MAYEPTSEGINNHLYKFIMESYHKILFVLTTVYSSLQNYSIAYRFDFVPQFNGKINPRFCLYLSALKFKKISLTIDNQSRPAYQLGVAVHHEKNPFLNYISIKAEQLGLSGDQNYSIYLQSHAINRLKERLDCVNEGILYSFILKSFNNLNYYKASDGNYLFEYSLNNEKVGYLKGELVEDKILIRTFLFLTNNGTPEGEKLHQNIGILKEDKKYLAIDKLSTFIHSDLNDNIRLKKLFIDSGCESLFNVDKNMGFLDDEIEDKTIADFIEKYLKIGT